MADNWGFVLAAYALAAIVLIAYWRMLARREREFDGLPPGSPTATGNPGERSRVAPLSGHPGSDPASRHPIP